MLENIPDTGYSDIDATILAQEWTAKMLHASAVQMRRLVVDNKQLKEDLLNANKTIAQQNELIEQLRAQIALMQSIPSQTNHIHVGGDYINNQYNDNNHGRSDQ